MLDIKPLEKEWKKYKKKQRKPWYKIVFFIFLVGSFIYFDFHKKINFNKWMKGGLIFTASLFILATIIMPFLGKNIHLLTPYVKNSFALANLEANVIWTGWEVIPGLFLLGLLLFFFRKLRQQQEKKAFTVLFGGTAIFVMLTLVFFIGKIEGYAQNAAISFFESKVEEDCYVSTFAYKSYAQLFYTKKQPPKNTKGNYIEWLLNGDIDKDVYIITKVDKLQHLKSKNVREIGRKNGFVFFKRGIGEKGIR